MGAGYRVRLRLGICFTAFSVSWSAGAQDTARYAPPRPAAIVKADIVAIDQLLVYNRFGSFNPFGMMFALRRDVVGRDVDVAAVDAETCGRQLGTEGGPDRFSEEELAGRGKAGNLRLRDCKRPRPLVLRANVGDVLELRIGNMLLSQRTPGPYDAGPDEGKPGLSGTFCPGREAGRRYGNPPAGPGNDEDAIWRGTDAMCRSEAQGRFPPGPDPRPAGPPHLVPAGALPAASAGEIDGDWPSTRHISFVINGLRAVAAEGQAQPHPACTGLGAIEPGEIVSCRWHLDRDGTHFISSQAAPSGGEGDGGSLTHGLFAALVVEPAGSHAYRSQVTRAAFDTIWPAGDRTKNPHARATDRIGGYEATDSRTSRPILNMLAREAERPTGVLPAGHELESLGVRYQERPVYRVVHSDLNAIVNECVDFSVGNGQATCGSRSAFREFTAILHDELKTFYTDNYQELGLFGAGQLAGVRDGFAINYGASGMGTMMLANRKRIGPAADCVECLYEEFFLQSWVNGDPALLEHYPDDPSNVHHSYLNDRIVFRNFHAGPKETHVFHLHAHQWFAGNDRNRGSYLDSQTVGPQQGFTYRIYSGGYDQYSRNPDKPEGFWNALGAGNRNRTPGDSIFHCHLYPHFAQGMWALWRNHDVLEDGSRLLPDGQAEPGLSLTPRPPATLAGNGMPERLPVRAGTSTDNGQGTAGTPIPGLIPLPDESVAPPPLPTYDKGSAATAADTGMPGYPFYIPGKAGRRAPQAPLDIARDLQDPTLVLDGGLPRHVIEQGVRTFAAALPGAGTGDEPAHEDKTQPVPDMLKTAGATLARSLALGDFTAHFDKLALKILPLEGTALEQRAMSFHHDGAKVSVLTPTGDNAKKRDERNESDEGPQGAERPVRYETAPGTVFAVNGAPPKPGAPFADPCAVPDRAGNAKVFRDSQGRFGEQTLKSEEDPFVLGHISPKPFVHDPGLIGFRRYEVSAINTWLVMNRAGWHDPQARINALTAKAGGLKLTEAAPTRRQANLEPFFFRAVSGECIEFRHTNELPKDLEKDDFQVKTPTDTIGQHIHLVKFDVMSADGSANGWNYEDGTFAPDELLARICAARAGGASVADQDVTDQGGTNGLRLAGRSCDWLKKEGGRPVHRIVRDDQTKRWFQTTVQRWFADPILSTTGRKELVDRDGRAIPETVAAEQEMRDRTLRTVFTHDHFGPSSIQQHGFYSALVIEPQRSLICRDRFGVAANADEAQTANCAPHRRDGDKTLVAGDDITVGARRLIIADKAREEREQAVLTASAEIKYAAAVAAAPSGPEGEAPRREARAELDRALEAIKDGDRLAHLNTREYLLAVADFATLYDPHADPAAKQISDAPGQGLLCLLREARRRLAMPATLGDAEIMELHRVCAGGAEAADAGELLRSNDMPPAWLATIRDHDVVKLEKEVTHLRGAYGKPIAPPRRPESISVDHHDPYLINYKNEPLALRVGTTRDGGGRLAGLRSCIDANAADRDKDRSIRFQRSGEDGDMANVFLTLKGGTGGPGQDSRQIMHGDPCTPVLDAFAGERVQVRLIQGAQEVQHAFTLEGYSFPRNIDQRLPSSSILPPQQSPLLAGMPTRFDECYKADKGVPAPRRIDAFLGRDSQEKMVLRARCDNVDGRVTAQEVGISEHFEFGAAFTSEGTNAEAIFAPFILRREQESLRNQLRELQRSSPTLRLDTTRPPGAPVQGLDPQSLDALARRSLVLPPSVPDMPRSPDEILQGRQLTSEQLQRLILQRDQLLGAARAPVRIPSSDSLYHFGSQDALWNGAWGLLRVFENSKAADHPTCIQRAMFPGNSQAGAASDYRPDTCTEPVGGRLTSLRDARSLLHFGAVTSSDKRIDVSAATADIKLSCPDGKQPYLLEIRAEDRPRKLYRSAVPQLSDPNALRFALVRDARQQEPSRNAPDPDGPLVLRVNAGDCFTLRVLNALPAAAQGGAGPDQPGDARMPPIVPLNTDRGGWREFGRYDAAMHASDGVLRPSSKLAVSLPLTTTVNRKDTPAPFGLNEKAALPSSTPFAASNTTYFAGTMISDWLPLEHGLRAPNATGIAECAAVAGPFVPNYAQGASPVGAKAVDILGRIYLGNYTPAQKPVVTACVVKLVERYKQPAAYAFGAIPLKSYGDVIGHVSHGLAGTLIVEPQGSVAVVDRNSPSATAVLTLSPADIPREALDGDREMLPRKGPLLPALQARTQSEHVLLWQDGLNLHMRARRPLPPRLAGDPGLVAEPRANLVGARPLLFNNTPLADCHVCDDSYDWGKRGVNYRSGQLAARLKLSGPGGNPHVDGMFDLNGVPLPKAMFSPAYAELHLPVLASRRGDDVAIRIVHPGGRARQRAFVLTGAGYADLFPGFGFPDSALLMPGKAVTAHWIRRAESGCQLWRDGPNYMVGQGVWGLHGVVASAGPNPASSEQAADVCRDASQVR